MSPPLPEVAQAVARLGVVLLGTGTASYRVERSMLRAGTALGCEHVFSLVTLRKVVVTVQRGGQSWTEGAAAPQLTVNAARLDAVERLVRRLPSDARPQQLQDALDEVLARPAPYAPAFVAVAVGAACAGFAGLSGGGPAEMGAAFVGAAVAQRVRTWMAEQRLNPFLVVTVTAVVAAGLYLAVVRGLQLVDLAADRSEAGFVSPALLLVPGFPLVTGTLDLLRTQVESGVARLTYATTVLVMASVGLLAVSALADPESSGLRTDVVTDSGWPAALALTFVGAWGFGVLFALPAPLTLVAGATAVVGNAVRLALEGGAGSPALAALSGAVVIGLVGSVVAPRLHVSRIVVTIPAVIPMVPGAAAYAGLVELSRGALLPALSNGIEAALVIGGLALGLAVARIVTDPEWLRPD